MTHVLHRLVDSFCLNIPFAPVLLYSDRPRDHCETWIAKVYIGSLHDQKMYHDTGLRHQPYTVGAMVWLNNPVESRRTETDLLDCQSLGFCGERYNAQTVHYNGLRPYTLPVSPLS